MRIVIPANEGWEFSRANSSFKTVRLPHQALPEPSHIMSPRTEEVVYRYAFDAPEEWREKIVEMSIGAAMQVARVFVNDRYCFTHFGGYQRFIIPLTDNLRFGGRNVVRIELDNRPTDDVPPGKPIDELDYCYHSGLHRGAWFAVYDRVHISDELAVQVPAGGGLFVRTEGIADGAATIVAECHVVNEYTNEERFAYLGKPAVGPVSAHLAILAPGGQMLAEADAPSVSLLGNNDHTFRFRVELANAPLWSTDAPNLCNARHLAHPPFTFNGVPDGDLEVVGFRDGHEAARQSLRTLGPAVGLRVVVRDEGVPPVEGDLVFVDAELVDGAGDIVPEARPVRFQAEGGEIVGAMEATEAGIASCLVRAGAGGAIKLTAHL